MGVFVFPDHILSGGFWVSSTPALLYYTVCTVFHCISHLHIYTSWQFTQTWNTFRTSAFFGSRTNVYRQHKWYFLTSSVNSGLTWARTDEQIVLERLSCTDIYSTSNEQDLHAVISIIRETFVYIVLKLTCRKERKKRHWKQKTYKLRKSWLGCYSSFPFCTLVSFFTFFVHCSLFIG